MKTTTSNCLHCNTEYVKRDSRQRLCLVCSKDNRIQTMIYRSSKEWREKTRLLNKLSRDRNKVKVFALWRKNKELKCCTSCKNYISIEYFTRHWEWWYLWSCNQCIWDVDYWLANMKELQLLWKLVNRCRQRLNIAHNMSVIQIHKMLIESWYKCAATWVNMILTWRCNRDPFLISIDRIDSTKWYTMDNIQLVSLWYNYLKNSADEEYAIEFINAIKMS